MFKRYTPTLFVALVNFTVFVAINGFQLITQTPLFYINKWIMTGVDYHDFYQASVRIISGGNPYEVGRFVTPPLFAFVNLPLAIPKFDIARFIFVALIPITVLISYLVIHRAVNEQGEKQDAYLHLDALIIIFLSYPLYFLFERGNIDGVVLICMCIGLVKIDRYPHIGGFLIAASIHFKVYPLLLLIPLFASRRWKQLFWTCAWLLVIALLLAPYWDDYFSLLTKRSNSFQLFENGSLINTFLFLGRLLSMTFNGRDFLWSYAPTYATILFSLALAVSALADYRILPHKDNKTNLVNSLLYFPFMVAFPKSVYHYEFVVLIPLLPVLNYLWSGASQPSQKFAVSMIVIGVALSQWHAVALYLITENIGAYYIPGVGLLCLILGISVYKWQNLRQFVRTGI
ncbi:MAG TPA: glycosyltransferase family 87 protein [Anaerolineales bacterium]|nr:glycosyltransferase family 87 protein [Anaerolineales bacterium]